MAIVSVKKISQRAAGHDFTNGRTYRETYIVRTDDAEEPLTNIREASHDGVAIPPVGTGHPDDPGGASRVQSVDPVTMAGHPHVWSVSVDYGQATPSQMRFDNPETEGTTVVWGNVTYQEPIDQDIATGDAIVNSAREFYEPRPMRDVIRPMVTMTRNEAIPFDIDKIRTYVNTVNSDNYGWFGPGESKMQAIRVEGDNYSGLNYVRVSYEIHFNFALERGDRPNRQGENLIIRGGWQLNILDAGFNYRIIAPDTPNELVPFTDSDSNHYTDPQLLNGVDGRPLPPGPEWPAVFFYWQRYLEVPWAPLNLTPPQ